MSKSKLIIVGTAYHRRACGQPTSVDLNYSRVLELSDPPYEEEITVGPKWQHLDLRWIIEAATIIIHNPAPQWQRNPTPEQRTYANAMLIYVGFSYNVDCEPAAALIVRPGESCHFEPAYGGNIYLKCPGTTLTNLIGRCRVTAIAA